MIDCIANIDVPKFESEGLELYFFGDEQDGSDGYCLEAWETFKAEFKASKKKKAAIGLGDYSDWLRPSMRPLLRGALGKDNSARRMLDKQILASHDKIIDKHEFLKGHLIGLHEGHHNWTTLDGINLDQRMSSALKTTFLGFAAGVRLVMHGIYKGKPSLNAQVVTILSTHGNANGRKVPGALSWVENNLANSWIADLYVVGHGCKSGNDAPNERSEIKRSGVAGIKRSVPRIMAVGGFARGWTNGWESGYVEQAGMSPQPLGWGVVRFKLVKRVGAAELRGCLNRGEKTLDVECVNRFYTGQ